MPVISCGELDTYYEDHGSGPVIVWLPGTGLRGSTWELQVEHFRDRYRCLTVDLRGSGGTGGAGPEFTVRDLAADVAAWLDELGVTTATVIGLSLGSAVAQELALARPDLVERVVLLATWSSCAAEHHLRRHFESRLYALEHGPLDVYGQFGFWMSSPTLFDLEPDRQIEVERLLRRHMSANTEGTAGPRVVVLCDVSSSMRPYTPLFLGFVHSLTKTVRQVESAVFNVELVMVTELFRRTRLNRALAWLSHHEVALSGGTRIGHCLNGFLDDLERRGALRADTIAVILSDGWDVGEADLLQDGMRRLRGQVGRVVWCDPHAASTDFRPQVQGLRLALPYVDDYLDFS
ncbi:alpha/beta fold hydrolase, partial [Amycolatopsis sp.]|uniref:alpha/beta fold hydrolase n=1 Tax=Amycolatopsis sp. TaxID=37632 RepID=UPI002DFF559C|nr:alpha/beta fold hydrolase [Amycolatopsis sp.]